MEHALKAEPATPSVGWEVANMYLRQNDEQHALPLLRRLIDNDAPQTDEALDLAWETTRSIDQMVLNVLPLQPRAYFRFLKILAADEESAAANQLWDALAARQLKFPVVDAFPFFNYLIGSRQVDKAQQVWGYLKQLDPELREDSRTNLIVNGGFERRFLNGGFAWRIDSRSSVEISIDPSESHSGHRSLGILFKGPPVPDIGVYQYVPVQPNTTYRLTAFAKSQDIDSPIGPRLSVENAFDNKTLASTDDLPGTSGWRQLVTEFSTGPETRLVTVRITHLPEYLRITGTFWLDDVSLSPLAATENSHP